MTKRTILVVEDEPIIRMIAVETLEEAGCKVVEFGDAAQAIAFCKASRNEIAALFTDINMAGTLDGLDVALHVVASRPDADVIVTSGRYVDKPADLPPQVVFLPKPWNVERLMQALRDVIEPNDVMASIS